MDYLFFLPDKPIPWSRPGSSKGRFYDPQCDVKENIRQYVKKMFLPPDFKLIESLFIIHYIFQFEMPKSWSKKKKERMYGIAHRQRPDSSNLVKFYEDAFNGFIFKDDCEIWNFSVKKKWSDKNQTIIQIIELPENHDV